jgi:hypothetical protein
MMSGSESSRSSVVVMLSDAAARRLVLYLRRMRRAYRSVDDPDVPDGSGSSAARLRAALAAVYEVVYGDVEVRDVLLEAGFGPGFDEVSAVVRGAHA